MSSFCSAKATHISSAKNIRILYIESAKTVNEMTLNELVKLTTLRTTGPSMAIFQPKRINILELLYKTVHCKTVSDFRQINDGPQMGCIQSKMYNYIQNKNIK